MEKIAPLFILALFGRLAFAADWSGSELSDFPRNEANDEAPVLIEEPNEVVDFSNSTGTKLICQAKGKPEPKITWLTSDDFPVNNIPGLRYTDANGILEFPPFSAANFRQDVHSVSYKCLASNLVGSVVSKNIKVKAVILQHYEAYVYDVHVTRNNNAVIECHIPFFLTDYIVVSSWIKNTIDINSRDIDEHNKYVILSNGDLLIRDIQQSDHGSSFRCKTINRLTNTTKISSSAGKIFVTDAHSKMQPRIRKIESEITADEGDILIIPCIAEGNPVPDVQWFKKSSPNNPHLETQSIFLKFRSIKQSDGGSYECFANSTVGQQSAKVMIHVIAPLKVIITPKPIIASVGSSVEIVCKIEGNPIDSVKWLRNGKAIDVTNNADYAVTNNKITIKKVSPVMKGIYQCIANNHRMSAYDTTLLKLEDSPPTFLSVFKDVTLHPGDSLFLSCSAAGSPSPSISWFHFDTMLRNSEWHIEENGLVTSSLNISRVGISDGGIYTCKAETKAGHVKFSGKVNIYGPLAGRAKIQISAIAGQNIQLFCPVNGYPIEKIIWRKGSQTLPIEHRQVQWENGTFAIRNVQKVLDSGLYECEAKDSQHKSVKGFVDLKVMVPPKITPFFFQDDLVKEGMRARIQCVISEGDLPLSIRWTKDGRPIPEHLAVIIRDLDEYSSILTISSVSPRHNGEYTCTASNEASTTYSSARLSVNVPAKIIAFSFQDDQFFKGMRAHIICAVSQGDSPIQFTWVKDGQPIPSSLGVFTRDIDGHANSLSIESVSSAHTGNYTCVASNQAGKVTHTAQLLVYVAPKISPFLFQEDSQIEGSFARVTCLVYQGDLPIQLKWLKDDYSLNASDINTRTIDEFSNILTIERVTKKHSGNYTCVASNAAATTSHTAEFIVHVPPKIVPFDFQDDHLLEGMLVRVSCVVSRGDLPLTITWLKDDLPLASDLNITIRDFDEYSSVLSIDPVTVRHNGNYCCVTNNHAGTAVHTAALTVYVPPQWILSPNDTISAVNGVSLLINCQADGFPKPIITWKKALGKHFSNEQTIIRANNRMKVFENGSLFFYNMTDDDKGLYFCYASNGVGVDRSKSVLLQVHAPVYFKKNNETVRAKLGLSAVLQCEASGERPIEFVWRINGKKLGIGNSDRFRISLDNSTSNGMLYKLTIPKTIKEDHGIYTCSASNFLGNASMMINLIIQEFPSAPEITSLRNVGNRSVEISWTKPFDGHSQLLKYSLQLKKKQDSWTSRSSTITFQPSVTTTVIKDLNPATHYDFRIAAENEVGIGPFGDIVSSVIDEEAPEGPPEQVEIETVNTQTLRVSWKPPKKSTWNGVIRGYRIGYRNHESNEDYTFHTLEVPEDYTDDLIYQITNLQMFTKYEIVVQAYNNGGRSPYSDKIIIMTSEDVPDQPPTDVRCSALSSHTLYVVWNPPPVDSVNGILLGYKVFYKSLKEWTGNGMKYNNTILPKIMLTGLEVNANYSIQISAFTKLGEGVKSDPIYCKTYEDVPGAPSAIKALPASETSVLVSWKAPLKSYGSISKYNVYYTTVGDKEEHKDYSKKTLEGVNVQTLDSDSKTFEVKGLLSNVRYEFWVTALSSIGEGPISPVIRQQPTGSEVAAEIASFDEMIKTKWKRDVELPCRAIGKPVPQRNWFQRDRLLIPDERLFVRFDGTLLIKKVTREDAGNYTCEIRNKLGHDEIHYSLTVIVPPDVPLLDVISKTFDSVRLEWQTTYDGGDPIQSYVLHYRKQNGRWETKDFLGNVFNYVLDNLSCGTTYQLYMEAVNGVGASKPSETITVNTFSESFQLPSKASLIQEGSMYVTVHLDAWPSTACPVKYFVLEYKLLSSSEWIVFSNNLKPTQKKLVLSNLQPGLPYVLRLSSYTNDEDFNIGEYMFSTHSLTGAVHPPDVHHKEEKVMLFYMNPWIFIPIVVFVIVCIIIAVGIFVYCKRKAPVRQDPPIDWTPYMTDLSGTEEVYLSDADYGTYYKTGGRGTIPRHGTLYRRNPDENIYATIGPSDRYTRMTLTRNRQGTISRKNKPMVPQDYVPRNSGSTNPFLASGPSSSNKADQEGFYNEPTNPNTTGYFHDGMKETPFTGNKHELAANENFLTENFGGNFNI